MNQFYQKDVNDLKFVTFDIETTGFKAAESDIITTIIFNENNNYYICLNTNGNDDYDSEVILNEISEASGIDNVSLAIKESEKELLNYIKSYISTLDKKKTIFTAFNGETYRGSTDFDIPFLRTRFLMNGLSWPFTNMWYTDTYELFSQKNRFNTTVTEKPTIDNLKKSEKQKFINDMNLNIHYSSMSKSEILSELKKHQLTEDIDSFSKSQLKKYIDENNLDIVYKKLSSKELTQHIEEHPKYSPELVKEWYNNTGKEIGTMNMTTLDDIHYQIIEKPSENKEWSESLPFDIEPYNSFDPYEDSSEAVTGYENKEYVDLILHCLADVCKTVNLNKLMVEYLPKREYKPKKL